MFSVGWLWFQEVNTNYYLTLILTWANPTGCQYRMACLSEKKINIYSQFNRNNKECSEVYMYTFLISPTKKTDIKVIIMYYWLFSSFQSFYEGTMKSDIIGQTYAHSLGKHGECRPRFL